MSGPRPDPVLLCSTCPSHTRSATAMVDHARRVHGREATRGERTPLDNEERDKFLYGGQRPPR